VAAGRDKVEAHVDEGVDVLASESRLLLVVQLGLELLGHVILHGLQAGLAVELDAEPGRVDGRDLDVDAVLGKV